MSVLTNVRLDLVLIQRHIVGLSELDSPYKVIAADISNDEKLSALDIIELRKVILGVQDEFNSVDSWRFVDAAQEFADVVSPWPVDYSVDIDNLESNINSAIELGRAFAITRVITWDTYSIRRRF